MVRGNMELPTIQKGKRKVVRLGRQLAHLLVYHTLLNDPKRVLGARCGTRALYQGEFGIKTPELDGCVGSLTLKIQMVVIFLEKYFHCYDLVRDLVPMKEYHASERKDHGTQRHECSGRCQPAL